MVEQSSPLLADSSRSGPGLTPAGEGPPPPWILDALPESIAFIDARGTIVATNEAWRRSAVKNGLTGPAGLGLSYLEVWEQFGTSGLDSGDLAIELRSALALETSGFSKEYSCDWPEGRRRFRLDVKAVYDERLGDGALAVHHDITDRFEAEAWARQSQDRYRAVFNLHFQYLAIVSPEGRVLDINELPLKAGGVTRDQIIGRPFWETIWWTQLAEIQEWWAALLAKAVKDGAPIHRVGNFRTASGELRDVEITVTAVTKEGTEEVDYYIVEGVDTTENTRASGVLGESEARLRAIVDASPIPKLLTDGRQNVTFVNPAFLEAFGYATEQVRTLEDWWIVACPDENYRAGVAGAWELLLLGSLPEGSPQKPLEIRIRCRSGVNKTVLASAAPLDQEIRGPNMMVLYDITERKLAEERLLEKQALLRIAGHAARLGGYTVDVRGARVTWSDEACVVQGMPPGTVPTLDEAIGFYAPEWRDTIRTAFELCVSKGAPFDVECEGITGGGKRIWVRAIGQADRDEAGSIWRVQGAIQDITDRKGAELALWSTNRALKMLSGCNEALIRAEGEDALLESICRIAVEMGGYRRAAIGFAVDDAARSLQVRAQAGAPLDTSGVHQTWADGPAESGPAGRAIRLGQIVLVDDLTLEPALGPIAGKLSSSGLGSGVFLPLKDGHRTFGVLGLYAGSSSSPGADELKLLRELTDDLAFGIGNLRSRAQREKGDAELVSSLREKEALLKEVHHRVKNNMQVITSLLRLEANRIDHPGTQSVLKDMQHRIQAMAVLHETLYRSGDFAKIDLGAYLGQLTAQLKRSLGASPGVIDFRVDTVSMSIDLDQAVPCGLIANELVTNAIKHGFPAGRPGSIWVETRVLEAGQVSLRVRDDGVGLPKDFDARRTQSLGLQLVNDLARQLGGTFVVTPPAPLFDVTFTPTASSRAT